MQACGRVDDGCCERKDVNLCRFDRLRAAPASDTRWRAAAVFALARSHFAFARIRPRDRKGSRRIQNERCNQEDHDTSSHVLENSIAMWAFSLGTTSRLASWGLAGFDGIDDRSNPWVYGRAAHDLSVSRRQRLTSWLRGRQHPRSP